MTITDIIEEIVSTMTVPGSSPAIAPNFEYGSKYWQNLNLDEVDNHVVWLWWPIASDDTFQGPTPFLNETFKISIAFLEKSELEDTPAQKRAALDRQRTQHKVFFGKLKERTDVFEVSNIRTEEVINMFNVNMDGCICGFACKIKNTVSVC